VLHHCNLTTERRLAAGGQAPVPRGGCLLQATASARPTLLKLVKAHMALKEYAKTTEEAEKHVGNKESVTGLHALGKILGVPQTVDQEESKKSYCNLALKWHTDKNLDRAKKAKAVFQDISEAVNGARNAAESRAPADCAVQRQHD
jgi:hypothetical protein